MKRGLLCLMCVAGLLSVRGYAEGGIVVPAGTIIRCTLDETNFSSATADIGDPVLCHLASLQEFGHSVFPRGSYLAGHLEADKEPGHFAGKGYLKLQFDRIGMPDGEVPVPSKIIAARGYKVDKQGDIVGKGHAKRDVAEWMIPPLWPWKVLMLQARGPRPTLKGEEQVSLRLMEDIEVPVARAWNGRTPLQGPGWHYFGQPSSSPAPRTYNQAPVLNSAQAAPQSAQQPSVVEAALPQPSANTDATPHATRTTTLVLKSDASYRVSDYRMDGDRVTFVLPSGKLASVETSQVDWRRTSQLNAGVRPSAENVQLADMGSK
jgi:hypothetical protein